MLTSRRLPRARLPTRCRLEGSRVALLKHGIDIHSPQRGRRCCLSLSFLPFIVGKQQLSQGNGCPDQAALGKTFPKTRHLSGSSTQRAPGRKPRGPAYWALLPGGGGAQGAGLPPGPAWGFRARREAVPGVGSVCALERGFHTPPQRPVTTQG